MCNKEYNGWTNYPTWNVNLWIGEGLQDLAEECAANHKDSAIDAGEAVRDMLEELMPQVPETGMQADIWGWAWEQVNWREIGQHLIDNLEPEDENTENESD